MKQFGTIDRRGELIFTRRGEYEAGIYALPRIALGLHVLIALADRAGLGRMAQGVRRWAFWIDPFIGRASGRWPRGFCFIRPAKFERALGPIDQSLARSFGLPARDLLVQTLHGRREDVTLFPRAAIVRGGPRALGRGLAAQLPALARGNRLRAIAPFAHELAQLRQILIRQKPQCRMVGFFHEGQFIRAEQPAFVLHAASHRQIPPRRMKFQGAAPTLLPCYRWSRSAVN